MEWDSVLRAIAILFTAILVLTFTAGALAVLLCLAVDRDHWDANSQADDVDDSISSLFMTGERPVR